MLCLGCPCFDIQGSDDIVYTQQAQNICITFTQRRPNVFDVGPTLCKCYTNVLCLLSKAQKTTRCINPMPAQWWNISMTLTQHWTTVYKGQRLPSKHEALARCWADVGPSSTTLAQHQASCLLGSVLLRKATIWFDSFNTASSHFHSPCCVEGGRNSHLNPDSIAGLVQYWYS